MIDKYNFDFDNLDKYEIFGICRFAISILNGECDFTNNNPVWVEWKKNNNINDIQSLLLFRKEFLPRMLLGTTLWFQTNGGPGPAQA